jgi:hypothetical protein|tara:strand:- start:3768 stop:4739 length:972 start_codon:yes stop_codon:yes gene_type:complete
MKKDKLIIFGPWVGEFCYELSWWVPEIRKMRNTTYKDHDAVAISFNGRKILYEDFTQNYIPIPKELDDTLIYPATCGEHVNGRDIIPQNIRDFVGEVVKKYEEQYNEVVVYTPNNNIPFNYQRVMSDEIFGELKHYNASPTIISEIKKEITFNNNRKTIAIMARIRHRLGKVCHLDWNPKHWETFIKYLIEDLKVNVVMIGIRQKENSSAGGSLVFNNSKYIKNIIFEGEDSVERQIALLQSTQCSIYGASGTAVFPFFTQTPTFTQQTVEEGYRLKFKWERELSNNLKNIKITDKYSKGHLWDSPPEELYEEFKEFYINLGV